MKATIFMTAYVVGGLSQAKAAGVEVNQDSVQRGTCKWLRAAYGQESRHDRRSEGLRGLCHGAGGGARCQAAR